MAETSNGAKNIFRVVEQIQIGDIKNQAHGYFGLIVIGNAIDPGVPIPIPLIMSALHPLI